VPHRLAGTFAGRGRDVVALLDGRDERVRHHGAEGVRP
jgi:hypothetical protein